jgi:hypothetical protein
LDASRTLTQRVLERIARDFTPGDRVEVEELLGMVETMERERVQLAILHLAHGDKDLVYDYVGHAMRDYRDILYWAEYPEDARIDTPEKEERLRAALEKFGVALPTRLKK